LVINNKKQYEGAKVSFQSIDVSKPDDQKRLKVRKVDLVTCLDVIGVLPGHPSQKLKWTSISKTKVDIHF
jgi:hypothetical protein